MAKAIEISLRSLSPDDVGAARRAIYGKSNRDQPAIPVAGRRGCSKENNLWQKQ